MTQTTRDGVFEKSNRRLLSKLPKEQLDKVFTSYMCDIEPQFLGFVDIYDRISQIVPAHWAIVDLGCAYAPQAFFFDRHKKYVGVDILTPVAQRFSAENSQHFFMNIADFIQQHGGGYNLDETFAVCSYVPPWHSDNRKLAREFFPNVFTYYPHGGFEAMIYAN